MQCVRVTPCMKDMDLTSQQLLRGGPMYLIDGVSALNFEGL